MTSYLDYELFLTMRYSVSQCDPYFDDIGCSHPGCTPEFPTPKCVRKCIDKNQLWSQSKHYGVNAYRTSSDPHDIMAEVYKNGPVEVDFTVYEVKYMHLMSSSLLAFAVLLCEHKLLLCCPHTYLLR